MLAVVEPVQRGQRSWLPAVRIDGSQARANEAQTHQCPGTHIRRLVQRSVAGCGNQRVRGWQSLPCCFSRACFVGLVLSVTTCRVGKRRPLAQKSAGGKLPWRGRTRSFFFRDEEEIHGCNCRSIWRTWSMMPPAAGLQHQTCYCNGVHHCKPHRATVVEIHLQQPVSTTSSKGMTHYVSKVIADTFIHQSLAPVRILYRHGDSKTARMTNCLDHT